MSTNFIFTSLQKYFKQNGGQAGAYLKYYLFNKFQKKGEG